MKSLFDADAQAEILNRLENLDETSKAKWGKMNVNQMLVHCQKPIELSLGESSIKKPNFIKRMVFKMISPALYNDKPWKEGLPTAQEYVITDNYTFETEKKKLKSKIESMGSSRAYFEPSKKHPYFGVFTADQWGKSAYKHLDHHLKQFGA
jgi:hypothetical protein